MTMGTRLRRLRLACGLTQKQLADGRYTHAYISSIEAGRRHPSREALEHLAARLGVDVDELATGRPADLAVRLQVRLQEARLAVFDGASADAERELLAIAKEAKRHGLRRTEARAAEAMGLLFEQRSRPEEALEQYQRAESLLEGEPATVRVDAVDGRASCFASLGDVRHAIHLLEGLRSELDREGLADPDALARVHASLVSGYIAAGLFTRAADSAAELERLAPRVSDPMRVGQMHMQVARLHLRDGRIADAEASLRRAEDAFRALRLEAEVGHAHLARGYVSSRRGSLNDAHAELSQAVDVFERTQDENGLALALNELARVSRLEGDTARAKDLLERSIAILGTSDTPARAWAHRELGIALAGAEPAAAETHLRLAIDLYQRTEQGIDAAVTYRALGDVLAEAGDHAGAADVYRTGILALEPPL